MTKPLTTVCKVGTPAFRKAVSEGTMVYVGRRLVNARWQFDRSSPYANPYLISYDGDRDTVIEKYIRWLYRNPHLLIRANEELVGKVLACWCHPEHCHADVLARFVNEGVKS